MEVKAFATPHEFLDFPSLSDFACVVLDVCMPGLDGLALQERLHSRGCDLPIVFISGHGEIPDAVRAMKAGAVDFLTKPFEDYSLLNAITVALSRLNRQFDEKLAISELRKRYALLTPREREIMSFVTQGKQNKLIAYELGIAESTVKVHRHNVMLKMKMRSLPELTLAAQRLMSQGS
jgi:FixJ family two-component response regulator